MEILHQPLLEDLCGLQALLVEKLGRNDLAIRPGYDRYEGSESHGIVSGSHEVWGGSYRVSAFRLPAR